MANKMITEKELRDEFLTAMIQSEEPLRVPQDFSGEVMNRIGLIPQFTKLKPYTPPFWLKWGIPGIIIVCLIGLLISGPVKEPAAVEPVASFFEKVSTTISSWFSGFNTDFKLPGLNIPETALWVLAGGIVLTWSFLLLFRFLEKKSRE